VKKILVLVLEALTNIVTPGAVAVAATVCVAHGAHEGENLD
jgi:hypothetical protein